ncbi:TenA family transcriptional regulator [Alteromonas gilva]|uniref:Iron-containing redox enzyme family protein n=1 Tax=Alteromonas gilva TaxID=2987522 RepID=A0ABT5L0E6_9ALTE|nr:iron-containing redox enzyme family protein [Alteromonas gilva]MDC8829283.1 iron-containing redox enzyme family protein [Alteromonas gilva]
MNLFTRLEQETQAEKAYLIHAPIIQQVFNGDFTLDDYSAFLCEAYHHVKHTVPLLMATGAALPESKEWLRAAVAEYIAEELGHQEWILNDLAACGADKEQVRAGQPAAATELMVAYAYDAIRRKNPLCFFGMVFVLEGTSIALADNAAAMIKQKLSLPDAAFSYLRSHGSLDQEHIVFFRDLMNNIDDKSEQDVIIHSAKIFFQLYANIFRTLGNAGTLVEAA